MNDRPTVGALERGLSLLDVLERSGRALSLAELARASGMHKSTALRLLNTLRQCGYVQRYGTSYEVGGAAFKLGLSFQRRHLLDLVRPTLIELLAERYLNPSFHVRYSPDARVCVLHARIRDGQYECAAKGDVLPLEKGAPSRVISTFEAGAPQDRKVGAMVSWGERVRHHVGIAAPVFGSGDRLLGALAVCGPQDSFTDSSLRQSCLRVVAAAAALSSKMGCDSAFFDHTGMAAPPRLH